MVDRDVVKYGRAAKQRLAAAEFLLANQFNREAMYLAGYVVECAFKALILDRTPRNDRSERLLQISRGNKGHDIEYLNALLRSCGLMIPPRIIEQLRLIRLAEWSTDWRYEVGLVPSEDASTFILASKTFLEWKESALS